MMIGSAKLWNASRAADGLSVAPVDRAARPASEPSSGSSDEMRPVDMRRLTFSDCPSSPSAASSPSAM